MEKVLPDFDEEGWALIAATRNSMPEDMILTAPNRS